MITTSVLYYIKNVPHGDSHFCYLQADLYTCASEYTMLNDINFKKEMANWLSEGPFSSEVSKDLKALISCFPNHSLGRHYNIDKRAQSDL